MPFHDGDITLEASETFGKDIRLKVVAGSPGGEWAIAAATDPAIAISYRGAAAIGNAVAGRLVNGRTFQGTSAGAIAIADRVKPAAAGKYEEDAAGLYVALTATSGADEQVELALSDL